MPARGRRSALARHADAGRHRERQHHLYGLPVHGQQTFADLYQMTLAADATDRPAAEFQRVRRLPGAAGREGHVVDEDDDGGGNTNSRITRALSGRHVLRRRETVRRLPGAWSLYPVTRHQSL